MCDGKHSPRIEYTTMGIKHLLLEYGKKTSRTNSYVSMRVYRINFRVTNFRLSSYVMQKSSFVIHKHIMRWVEKKIRELNKSELYIKHKQEVFSHLLLRSEK